MTRTDTYSSVVGNQTGTTAILQEVVAHLMDAQYPPTALSSVVFVADDDKSAYLDPHSINIGVLYVFSSHTIFSPRNLLVAHRYFTWR